MYLDAAKKQEIFEKYGKSNTDTGSAEAQIALFSYRISQQQNSRNVITENRKAAFFSESGFSLSPFQ